MTGLSNENIISSTDIVYCRSKILTSIANLLRIFVGYNGIICIKSINDEEEGH